MLLLSLLERLLVSVRFQSHLVFRGSVMRLRCLRRRSVVLIVFLIQAKAEIDKVSKLILVQLVILPAQLVCQPAQAITAAEGYLALFPRHDRSRGGHGAL